MERVSRIVTEKPVVIFSKTIKSLFSDLGVNTAIYELDEMQRGHEIEAVLSNLGCNPTVFIGGEMVGGENEVMSLHLQGSLKPKLKSAGALWV
ncbi:monothiol glutaredoxin-S3-like [Nicotiana tabacum]|uniref:monothiol glutaredoxin-S3-like n=1 Tax=Nicotiana tabacum TaxID=4097 RepID=UPI003F4E4F20